MSAKQKNSGAQVPLTDGDRTGWATDGNHISGSGSHSTLYLTDEQMAEIKQRPKNPIGFA